MKKIYLFLLASMVAITVQAQTPAKTVRQGVKAATSAAPRTTPGAFTTGRAQLPHGLDRQITQTVANAPHVHRSWMIQQARNYKAWQLKRQRRLRDAQALKLAQQAQELQARRAALPPLRPEQAFETDDFTPFVTQELPSAPLPLLEEPGVLYRGLSLPADGTAVKNILTHGLLLKDLGSHATTKLLAVSGGTRGTVSAVKPITNLTSLPQDAVYWATQHKDHALWVVVSVEGISQSGKIVMYSADIPASQITQVLIPLQLNAVPTWCKISLTQDGRFWVTPYQTAP